MTDTESKALQARKKPEVTTPVEQTRFGAGLYPNGGHF